MSKRTRHTPVATAEVEATVNAAAVTPAVIPVAAPARKGADAADIAWAHAEVLRLVPLTRPCGCSCGAEAKGRFLPGHDAKLVSRLLKERAEDRKSA